MVWACRSPDYLILKGTVVCSKHTGLLNDASQDYTHVGKAYFTYFVCCSKQKKKSKEQALSSGHKFQAGRFVRVPMSSLTNFGGALKRDQPQNTQ